MFHIITLIWFIASSLIWWMVIWWVANAYIIPTYYKWAPLFTFDKAVIISSIIVIIVYLIFSPRIHSKRLKEYMNKWYSNLPTKKKK